MSEEKGTVEGEMGSGDSDDEFYNVKMPCIPTFPPDSVAIDKPDIRKVHSPSRTKIKYDYKFDSSSEDELEDADIAKGHHDRGLSSSSNYQRLKPSGEASKGVLPQNTYKVVEKINEELKNMKKNLNEKHDTITTLASNGNAPRGQMGVMPPVVVVPPPIMVPQPPVLNMSPVMVPSASHLVGITGTMLRTPSPMGGIMTSPNTTMSNVMMAMNPVQNQIGGMVGMQGNIVGLSGPGSMSRQGVMMRMPGSNMLNMQRPGLGIQASSNMMGMTGPGTLMGMQNLPNSGGLMVNPAGLMVMGGLMTNMPKNAGNCGPSNTAIRPAGVSQGNQPVRPVPPPPSFLGVRSRTPGSVNFKWQHNIRGPEPLSPTVAGPKASSSSSSPPPPPTATSAGDDDEDCDDYYSRDEEIPRSRTSSKLDPYESRSSSSSPTSLPKDSSNTFKNDGSFMEMFKKMNGQKNPESSSTKESYDSNAKSAPIKKPPVIISGIVGKRRGGRVLKTGVVKKLKKETELEDEKRPKDAWSMYMAEVKKYREASCEEEGKTRPLVK